MNNISFNTIQFNSVLRFFKIAKRVWKKGVVLMTTKNKTILTTEKNKTILKTKNNKTIL